jgi:hypothetical protein
VKPVLGNGSAIQASTNLASASSGARRRVAFRNGWHMATAGGLHYSRIYDLNSRVSFFRPWAVLAEDQDREIRDA